MGNTVNAFDFDNSLALFLVGAVGGGTYSDILETLKFDEVGNEATAAQIAAAGGQLWSNLEDDYLLATYGSFYRATKTWRRDDAPARDALGSDDLLVENDIGYTEDENRIFYVVSVDGAAASTWAPIPVRNPFSKTEFISDTLAATEDDYTPGGGWPVTQVLRLTAFAGDTTMSGIVAGESGQMVRIFNISAADSLVLTHDDASSAAANRFFNTNNASVTVRPNGSACVWYDPTSTRWRTA